MFSCLYIPDVRVSTFLDHETTLATNGSETADANVTLYIRHRYECQYGPKDLSDKVLTITPDMETKKPKYNVKGKLIPNGRGKAQPRIGAAANGMSIKRGCVCRFQVKQLYYLRDVAEIVYYNPRHENSASLVVHGDVLPGERGRFEKQIPVELRNWVLSSLRSGVSSNKILSTHRAEVMRLVAEGVPPERCHFLREWDVRNIAKELRKTEYQRDDNDAESVKMWVEANPDDVFFYRLVKKGPVSGTLTAANLPFVIGIQNEFQFKMMLQHGHESIVSMDATFGTNHWKVRPKHFHRVSFRSPILSETLTCVSLSQYPLYTLMVFDKWRNGVPVAFIIAQSAKEKDITPWLTAIKQKLVSKMPEWLPNAFIVDDALAEINAIM